MLENLTVVKRDNRKKPFSMVYIKEAIHKAYKDTLKAEEDFKYDYILLEPMIEKDIENLGVDEIEVETIQDIVIENLNKVCKIVAKSYQEYRDERTLEREANFSLYDDIQDVLDNCSPEMRENANKAGDKIQSIRELN